MNPWFIFSRSRWIFLFPTTHDQNIFCRQIYFPNHRGFYSLCYFYCYLSECPYSRLFIRVLICWCPRRLPQPAIFLWTFRHCSSLFFLFFLPAAFLRFPLFHIIHSLTCHFSLPPFYFHISPDYSPLPLRLCTASCRLHLFLIFPYLLCFLHFSSFFRWTLILLFLFMLIMLYSRHASAANRQQLTDWLTQLEY